MPIPFILVAAALTGITECLDAKKNMESAKRHNERAQRIVDEVNKNLEEKKKLQKNL